jgi:phage tail-like protein
MPYAPSPDARSDDPYGRFNFRVKWNGRYVAAVNKASALRRTTDIVLFSEGMHPDDLVDLGRIEYEPISLEGGVTYDVDFDTWARRTREVRTELGKDFSPATVARDILLEFHNDSGELVYVYNIDRCWPSEYLATPKREAGADAVIIEMLVLQNAGWRRDEAVTPPDDPNFF